MPVRMHHIDREFSPSEAAAITGVSVDLQRDWRRRGLLPENKDGKWTRFGLKHIIEMLVMKAFSEAGFAVSSVTDCAQMAILPSLAIINLYPGAVVFEGDEISDALKERSLLGSVRRSGGVEHTADQIGGRYLVMMKRANGTPSISRWTDLVGIDEFMAERKAIHCTILDCVRLVDTIVERAGLPLMRVEVERVDDDTSSEDIPDRPS